MIDAEDEEVWKVSFPVGKERCRLVREQDWSLPPGQKAERFFFEPIVPINPGPDKDEIVNVN